MASIASVYVEILPSTAAVADGIKRALLGVDSDVRKAAKRWQKEIDKELSDVDVTVDADTALARKEIKEVEKGKYTAKVNVDVDQQSLAKARALLGGGGGRGGGLGALAGPAIGHQACHGHGGGNTTWTCRVCNETMFGPPLNTHCNIPWAGRR